MQAAVVPCPFSIDPEDSQVHPHSSSGFNLKFSPLEVDDFIYSLRGTTLAGKDEGGAGRAPRGGGARGAGGGGGGGLSVW
jgi:hypothetical protein